VKGRTIVSFSGMMEVETDWRRVPALSSREVGFVDSAVSIPGPGLGITGGGEGQIVKWKDRGPRLWILRLFCPALFGPAFLRLKN
jgi:hypothetical protein